jgi:hypothetical protein
LLLNSNISSEAIGGLLRLFEEPELQASMIAIYLKAAALGGAAAAGHLRRCRSSTMPPHRLRHGALHLPARRSRQNANLFLREP